MRRTPLRPAGARQGASLSSPRENTYRKPPNDGNAKKHSGRRTARNTYADLDQMYLLPENSTAHTKISDETPKPRTRHLPEEFFTEDNSNIAVKNLPKTAQPETSAAEESILKKWEAWSTQMSTQLALENAVSATPLARSSPRNGSFHNVSQSSIHSISKLRPASARSLSPAIESGRRSASRCSSRSRQSSLVSTVVEPFKVGDRMTASAERKRHRPQSTKGSRELLFRRALGLEDDKSDIQNVSTSVQSRRAAPAPSPLITLSTASSSPRQPAELHRSLPSEVNKENVDPDHSQQATKDSRRELEKPGTKGSTEAAASSTVLHKDLATQEASLLRLSELRETENQREEWVKKSIALLESNDQHFAESVEGQTVPTKAESHEAPSPVTRQLVPELMEDKWHLPVGKAAQMICGRVVVQTIDNCPVPSIGYRESRKRHVADEGDGNSPNDDTAHHWVEWPIDRASVTVLFVDHHVDDDQLSAYGVEVSSRDECASEVLPDWNESRRRFAPAPLEDSICPQ
ncbi:hypothetical protein ABB37_08991 [Leptomonas pyrrhocoris]|uniref:Uncharacterized protein n=1 Tax=Leptomonas pyrrhocoris TaxID=157538 RepID=A0A0M9FRQ9_LEPPY|nr:hypothetical protein ABB37_08991 [Leptomonas pyrrhocoris]XP_015653097.1 hypothetical protein ABB37_08991 [Leptomonas pyrrhocoris]KPA74657.1 hypothetical protein ABB37_08991 [Leptomonas pyrrhocoris]KPA74658.1 hypothetical protein ABB37_08991 [Leptomonas pyrrhocoris]|eukprot:XP_015653096.1 hypothetical protein ABB37_08991 [Leptomonas pyrrhocoris]